MPVAPRLTFVWDFEAVVEMVKDDDDDDDLLSDEPIFFFALVTIDQVIKDFFK